ncbi:hypothetical protein ACFWUP_23740 [Nocardia sp. NPDC058658]|uniref:hypothetical protein n=1 Tax=Nocardia sp. NPDC058658 TaxID=3346580 RepID=UPI00364BEDD5
MNTDLHTQLVPLLLCNLPLLSGTVCSVAAESATSAVADTAIEGLIDLVVSGFVFLLQLVIFWWTSTPSPELMSTTGGSGSALAAIRDYTSGLQVLFLTAGILFSAARLALAKHRAAAGEAQETFLMLARAIMASTLLGAAIAVATNAGDTFSDWVLNDAAEGDLVAVVDRLTQFDASTRSGLGGGVLLIIGLLGLISSLVQLVMLVVRQALLILVVAVLPIAAAASGTPAGGQSYKKLLSWALAFVLWKPVGALVYAIAFTVAGRADQSDTQTFLLGLILMVMTVLVLPALIRLVAPAVATLGGGGGGGAVLAGAGAGIAMSAAGNRRQARTMTETGGGGGTPPNSGPPPGGGDPPPPGGGGGSRAMTPTPTGSGGSAGSTTGTGSAPNAGAASASGSAAGGGAAAGGAAGAGAGGGSAAAAAGAGGAVAGPVGVVVAGAVAAGAAAVRTAGSTARQAAEGGPDPQALGPGEVRR